MSEQFTINVRQGPTANRDAKNLEAAFARRSMMLVRRLLGEDKLIELLRDETAASTEYWKTVSAASDGKWKAARIVLSPRGLSSMDFVDWFLPAEGGMLPDQEKLAAHPEHWVVRPAGAPQTMTVLETLGERPTLFLLAFGLPRAEFVEDDETFTTKMTARGFMREISKSWSYITSFGIMKTVRASMSTWRFISRPLVGRMWWSVIGSICWLSLATGPGRHTRL